VDPSATPWRVLEDPANEKPSSREGTAEPDAGRTVRVPRFAIVTYFDRFSLKHLTWRLRHPFSRKARKPALSASEVAAFARANRARLVSTAPLSWFGSGHRYALLVKDGG